MITIFIIIEDVICALIHAIVLKLWSTYMVGHHKSGLLEHVFGKDGDSSMSH